MADLSSLSDQELLSLYNTVSGGAPPAIAPPKTEDSGNLGRFGAGLKSGAKRRALGLLQLALEAAGQEDSGVYKDTKDLAAQYLEETRGTGFSGTMGEIIGDPLTAAMLPVGGAATGLSAMAKLGALGGAIEGFTRPTEEGDSRLTNTALAGATGAVAAPVIGYAAGKAGQLLEVPVNAAKGAINTAKRLSGRVAADNLIGLEVSMGGGYDDFARAIQGMSEEATALFKQGVGAGLSPRQAYLAAKAKDHGAALTKGMLTQDPTAQRLEDYAAQGVLNSDASKVATATAESNRAAMRDWAGKLRTLVSGADSGPIDETAVADAVASGVKTRAAELKGPASEAYKLGAQSKARVGTENLADFAPNLKQALRDEGVDFSASPTFTKDIKAISKLTRQDDGGEYAIKSFKWAALDKIKQRIGSRARFDVNLNQVADYGQRQEILAYRKAAAQFNEKLDGIITNGLLKNPDEAAAALRKAPALWKEYRQTIYGKDGKAALGKIVDYDMTDRQVADFFGSSLSGKGDTQKVVAQLKNVLGDDSEAFGQVRGMFLNRLFKGALTEGDEIGGKSFGTALNTQWRQFETKNKALMDELFTPDMQKEIRDFVATSYLMSARNASKANPSGSGIVAMDGLINLFSRMGGNGIVGDLAKAGGKAVLLRGNSKQAIRSISEPLKDLGQKSTVISDALRRIGAVSGVQANRAASDALANPGEPTPTSDGPALQGLSDAELLQMYGEGDTGIAATPSSAALPADIRQDEGLRHQSYLDTTGHKTVGYGFNMDSGIARNVWKRSGIPLDFDAVYEGRATLNDAQAEALGSASFEIARRDAESIYDNFDNLSAPRKEALLNLSYQLGKSTLQDFGKFNSAVKQERWADAVRHLLKTRYATQTPERARQVARKLLSEG